MMVTQHRNTQGGDMIDRRGLAHDTHNSTFVNLMCHTVDDKEALRKTVQQRLVWALEEFPLVRHQLGGLFAHDQSSKSMLFFDCALSSPSGQCFDARDKLQWIEWWN